MRKKLLLFSLFTFGFLHSQTYTNSNPEAISDATNVTGACGNATSAGTGSSAINVPITATLTDPTSLTINLDLSHTWMGDVVAEIAKPDGGSCALIRRIGAATDVACGSGSDFAAGNVLSFNSANTTPVPTTNPVPAGSYAPTAGVSTYPTSAVLCDLPTFLNGVAVNGDWTLTVQDNGEGDTGTINSWSLVFSNLAGEDFIFTNSVSILGNPFENELVVKINNTSSTTATINLYSMDGKLVNLTSVNSLNDNISIDTTSLSKGVYLLVAEIDGVTQKGMRVVKK